MKRMFFMAFCFTALVFSPGVYAQTDAEIIERALSAAPQRDRDAASVIKWNDDFTYETIKEGANSWVCYDWSGRNGRPAFAVQCTHEENLPRVAQSLMFEAETSSSEELRARHRASEEAGERILPKFGSVFTSRNGPDAASARSHTTVAVPGATGESLGLPESPAEGGSWIMNAGSSYAHIMTPGT